MAKAKTSSDGSIEKLAEIADKLQNLHKGKMMVIFEMNKEQFQQAAKKMEVSDKNKFTIDISGTDFIFLLTEDE